MDNYIISWLYANRYNRSAVAHTSN